MATVLFVHAHPDDETLATGIALAHLRDAGHDARVLAMTLGEEGEVIPPELRHLAADREDRLGPYRREELRAAMATLDVAHSVLGADPGAGILSRYRDSGMAGTPSALRPDAFANADITEVAGHVADHITAVRADIVVTYDRHGGYQHPDHVQTHLVTCAAVRSVPNGTRPALYAVLTPRSWALEDRAWLAGHDVPRSQGWRVRTLDEPFPPAVVPDPLVTHAVVEAGALTRQVEALHAHRTQVTVVDHCYALSNNIAARLSGREGFALLDPTTGDLVAGYPRDAMAQGGADDPAHDPAHGAAPVYRHRPLVQDEA
jgi:N-acetyl-1-D-myo-inositol-2-amino-2-deoxy-alpha-D-glucopyranoside deacetylase